jgi:hypothetical protein
LFRTTLAQIPLREILLLEEILDLLGDSFQFELAILLATTNPPDGDDPRISKLKGSLPRRQTFFSILIQKRP